MIRKIAGWFSLFPFAITNRAAHFQNVACVYFMAKLLFANPVLEGFANEYWKIISDSALRLHFYSLKGNFDYILSSNSILNGDAHKLTLASQINMHQK